MPIRAVGIAGQSSLNRGGGYELVIRDRLWSVRCSREPILLLGRLRTWIAVMDVHWSKRLAPVVAPDPFANKHPVSPWLKLDIKLPPLGFW